MTENLVLDSSVFVASLLPPDRMHSPQPHSRQQYQAAFPYIDGLRQGNYHVHLPRLCVVEVCATIRRTARRGLAESQAAKATFRDWEQQGAVTLYDLDQAHMNLAIDTAIQIGLRGSDAIVMAVAKELGLTLKTLDGEIRNRYTRAESP